MYFRSVYDHEKEKIETRFGPKQVGGVGGSSVPGPGSYEATIATSDPLVKRSFNITIG